MRSKIISALSFLFLIVLMLLAMRVASAAWTSTNWAGYVINSNGVTAISASWTIPEVQCASTVGQNQLKLGVAVWIGFDGVTGAGASLIPEQIGTYSICWNCSPLYYGWEEDPSNTGTNHATVFHAELSAGDRITASIAYLGNNRFTLVFKDLTSGDTETYSNIMIPNSARTSAEWIVEAFFSINTQSQVTLPKFNPVTFADCTASVNNVAGSITQNNGQPMNMVDSKGNVIVTTQNLNQAGTTFQVAEVGS